MKKNLGKFDRVIRALAGISILLLMYTQTITGSATFIFGIIALVLLFTSVTSFCPCYVRLNINTGGKNPEENKDGEKLEIKP